jgi:hypothetical protein
VPENAERNNVRGNDKALNAAIALQWFNASFQALMTGVVDSDVPGLASGPQALAHRPWPTGPHKPGPSQAHSRAY